MGLIVRVPVRLFRLGFEALEGRRCIACLGEGKYQKRDDGSARKDFALTVALSCSRDNCGLNQEPGE